MGGLLAFGTVRPVWLLNPSYRSIESTPTLVFMTPRPLMRLIPHRGPIRQVDRIVFAETPLMIAGVKEVRDDEFWCEGHIPGRPVMPGVLQLEAGAKLASILDTLCHGPDRFMGLVRIDEASGSVELGDQLLLLGYRLKPGAQKAICVPLPRSGRGQYRL